MDLFKALRVAIQSEAKALFKYLEEYETMHQQLLETERTILTAAKENKEIKTPNWSELMPGKGNPVEEENPGQLPLDMAAAKGIIKILREANEELSQRQNMHEKELAIASDIQAKLLPQEVPENRDIKIAASNIMARSVGGDYYDFMTNDQGKLAVIVADSMGKGMPGALLMTNARAIWRSLSPSELNSPGTVLNMINHAIYDDMQAAQAFVTIFIAFYDPRSSILHYSSAGHNPALIHTPIATYCRELGVGGPPIGLFPDSEFPSDDLYLNSGDIITIYTDGIVEAVNDKKGSIRH